MKKIKNQDSKSYFELVEHNTPRQKLIFSLVVAASLMLIIAITLPVFEFIFTDFLDGRVHNGGEYVPYMLEDDDTLAKTNYLNAWAVDIYKDTPQEARYWFNPLLSVLLPSAVLAVLLGVIVCALLPSNLGLFRQKIEREIAHTLYNITLERMGVDSEEAQNRIRNEILNADRRDLHEHVNEWKMTIEDLTAIHKALKWRQGAFAYRLTHINDGITIYMRNYFTRRYSNSVLGLVYIGAAVLIIIIGLRGLKFIPSTHPSIVFFALGLEFSLLIIYAFTLIYSRQEEENGKELGSKESQSLLMQGGDFGNSKEIESLLRVFIKSKDKKNGSNGS